MADEFDFFSNDCNNWNYNPFINTLYIYVFLPVYVC